MTKEKLRQGELLISKIEDLQRVFSYFSGTKDSDLQVLIVEYFTASKMIPLKKQMASICVAAILQECKNEIDLLQNQFNEL